MKLFNELIKVMSKKDNTPSERLELNQVKIALETMCNQYLVDTDDILTFEALPSTIDYVIELFDNPTFTEKYEYAQVSDTVFQIKLRRIML